MNSNKKREKIHSPLFLISFIKKLITILNYFYRPADIITPIVIFSFTAGTIGTAGIFYCSFTAIVTEVTSFDEVTITVTSYLLLLNPRTAKSPSLDSVN